MTAREQLYEKLSAEYDAFIANLKDSTPDKILDAAFEKTSKEDIMYCFEYGGSFDDKEIDVLLAVENPLDELYKNWVDTDVSPMDDLRDSISGFVVRETEQRGEVETKLTGEPRGDHGLPVGQVTVHDEDDDREQTLIQRIDKNLKDYHNYLLGFGKREIIDMAGTINAWSEMHDFMSSHAFSDKELYYLLQFKAPMEVAADAWASRNADDSEKGDFLYNLCDREGALYNYPLYGAAEPEQTAEPEVADKPLTLWNRLDRKLEDEYNAFIADLETKSTSEIIQSSFEKVFREDLKLAVEYGDYDDEQLTAMLSQDHLLDSLYQDWRDSDVTYMDMLADCVDESVDTFVKEARLEQARSEPQRPKAKPRESSLLGDLRDAAREVEARKATQTANPAKKHDRGIE